MRSCYLLVCFFATFGSVHLSPTGGNEDYQDDNREITVLTESETFTEREGSKLVLPCEVENSDEGILTWKRKTDSSGKLEKVTHEDESMLKAFKVEKKNRKYNLIIPNIRYEDAGEYMCGEEDSDSFVTHRVNVRRAPSIDKISPEKHTYLEVKETLQLSCKASGFPEPRITWRREGKKLPNGMEVHKGATLHLGPAARSDSGTYVCQAENDQGEMDKKSVKITVKAKPEVEVKVRKVHAGVGTTSVLECIVHSFGHPQVKWMKNGVQVDGDLDNVEIYSDQAPHHHYLKFNPTRMENFGVYECHAKNTIGSDSKEVELTGTPSKPVKESVSASVDQKKPYASWKVVSYTPIIECQVRYKRQEDNEWTVAQLVVEEDIDSNVYHPHYYFTDLKQGTYHAVLKARNMFGWSEESDKVLISGAISPRLAQAGVFLQESQSSVAPRDQVSVLSVLIFSILMARWLQ